MKILVDFDNTIADSGKVIVEIHLKNTKNNVTKYNPKRLEWNFSPYITSRADIDWALSMFSNQDMYDVLQPIEGAREVLEKLSKEHEIIVVTKKSPSAIIYNSIWIKNNLPFIKRVVYLEQNDFDKSFISGDIFIDDKLECLAGNNVEHKLLFGDYAYQRPKWIYNDKELAYDKVHRTKDWYEVEKYINNII